MNTLTHAYVSSSAGPSFVAKAAAFVHNELTVRAAVRDLRQMDDRALADIGICRGEINDAVRGRRVTK